MMQAVLTPAFLIFLLSFICTLSATKPVSQEAADQSAVRRLDTLAGLTIGSSKSTRSIAPPYHARIPMDTLSEDEVNFLHFLNTVAGGKVRSMDSQGSANAVRNLDSLGGGNYLRALDSLGGGNLLRHPSPMIQQSGYDYRSLDSLGGGNLLRREQQLPRFYAQSRLSSNARSDKRLDTLSGITLGHQKRTFDEIDRTAFDDFEKRDFDEIDRTAFDGFSKRLQS
ncbi:hypothetical protein CHUAL_001731 [Chamberlinius hualienensis]